MFKELDQERCGSISLDDFMTRLHDFGLTDEEIENLFNRLDLDSDGQIDYNEFIHGYKLFAKSTGENFSEDWRLWNQAESL